MANTSDVIVIGAGHNGLTCAGYLARAGLRVTVLEARDVVGGAVVTRHPALAGELKFIQNSAGGVPGPLEVP